MGEKKAFFRKYIRAFALHRIPQTQTPKIPFCACKYTYANKDAHNPVDEWGIKMRSNIGQCRRAAWTQEAIKGREYYTSITI